jgi:leader peptidase (prepilin peptidase)/N-methyltransferase
MQLTINSADNNIITAIAFLLLGLVAGSFLNTLIYKIPRKMAIFKPYSVCFNCREPQATIRTFPLIAFASSKKKCTQCGSPIPFQSVAVEILNGLVYALVYLSFGLSLKSLNGIILASILITVSFIDWDFMIIPNIVILPFTLVGIVLNIVQDPQKWWMPLVFSAGAFVFMFIIHIIYPRGMGMGDVKLALMLGAFLARQVIVGLFAGFMIGSVAGIIFIIFKKRSLKQFIPFGPFLSAGGLFAFFTGELITGWYLGLF